MADECRIVDSKKYMWDGSTYETVEEARETKAGYEKDGFETIEVQEDGKHLVYTRRVVTEIVVEGAPPI